MTAVGAAGEEEGELLLPLAPGTFARSGELFRAQKRPTPCGVCLCDHHDRRQAVLLLDFCVLHIFTYRFFFYKNDNV